MPLSALVSATIFYLLSLGVPTKSPDLKVVIRESFSLGQTITSTQYLSSSYSRFEWANGPANIAGHHIADIVHYGESVNQRFMLDLDAHEYVFYETDKKGIRSGAQNIPLGNSGGTLAIWIESTDTGERRQMFGHTVRRIITKERRVPGSGSCSYSSESETDGWYMDYSVLPEWRRPHPGMFFVTAGNCRDKIEVYRSGVGLGFPLKVTTTFHAHLPGQDPKYGNNTSTLEVVEFKEAPLDPALFAVPPDFHRVAELTCMNTPRSFTAWEKLKKWLKGNF
ncbi:MAG TPA: hypothetical protein VI636_19325 [Candidatus Angelobacter sp.]